MGQHKIQKKAKINREPMPLLYDEVAMNPNEIIVDNQEGPVGLNDREGVYVHSFICKACCLHFAVYSWKMNRHTAKNITCPECGQHEGHFTHFSIKIPPLPVTIRAIQTE